MSSQNQQGGFSLGAAFHFNVGAPLLEGLATIGTFDGKVPSLACATVGNRILVHDSRPPKDSDATVSSSSADASATCSVRFLNFNREVTSVTSGRFVGHKGDALVLASATSVSAYNVEDNTDIFYRDISDGASATTFGAFSFGATAETPSVFVGGIGCVYGLNVEGQEVFWGATGERVTALAVVPWGMKAPPPSSDASLAVSGVMQQCLIVGSNDHEIKAFAGGADSVFSVTEGDTVNRLVSCSSGAPTAMRTGRFAYSLTNGTVGVYEKHERSWRSKAKAVLTSMAFCDVDSDGVPELICGWNDGRLEVRSDVNASTVVVRGGQTSTSGGCQPGDVLFRDSFGAAVSNVLAHDYRMEGRRMPIVCTFDGEVRGLVPLETNTDVVMENREASLLEALMKEKQQLTFDIKNIESQVAQHRANNADNAGIAVQQAALNSENSVLISPNTSVKVRLRPASETKSIDLCLSASDNAVIRGAFITGELVFPQGSSFFHSSTPTSNLSCPISLEKDVSTDLVLSVLVGNELSAVYQVHELRFRLPKFCMYVPVTELPRKPTGYAAARITDRGGRFAAWLASCFNTTSSTNASSSTAVGADGGFSANFISLRDGSGLNMFSTSAHGGELVIRCDDMDLCGDIIQDVAQFLGISDLETTSDFPEAFEAFRDVLQRVEEYNAVRMKLTAEMADATQTVKTLVIRAEDARILGDMRTMKRTYGNLYEVNRELMGEYKKRTNNHNELLTALKEVNGMIQKAGKLRVGQPKTRLITECRAAIKANNIHTLFQVIKTGKSS